MNYPLTVTRIARNAPASDNSCGECNACCDVMGVPEFGKPYYARCPHLAANCTIYHDRPGGCRGFRCVWHLGLLGDKPDYRPDRFGLILSLDAEEEANFINVYEVRPGALQACAARLPHLLDRAKRHAMLKHARWHDIAVRFYAYGSDISAEWPVNPIYLPYVAPEGDIRVEADLQRGEATFSGKMRGLLMPGTGAA